MKKRFSGLLAFLLVLALFAQSAIPVSATETAENYEVIELETNRTLLSLTETRTVEVMADFGDNVELSQLEFLFGGKVFQIGKSGLVGQAIMEILLLLSSRSHTL